jgi:hypothetical protein
MDLAVQLMMGVSLGACSGMRAWLPMLIVALLKRGGYVTLNPSFGFLDSDAAVVVFAVAAVAEILADKFPGVDHALDSISTVVRPAVGTVLASSMIKGMDPLAAVVLGMIVGGGPSILVHSAKAATRLKLTALMPAHAGMGNAAASTLEDLASAVTLWLTVHAPVLAFVLVILAMLAAGWIVYHALKTGAKLFRGLASRLGRHPPAGDAGTTSSGP